MKNKYIVYIKEVHVLPVEVEAETSAAARAKVADMLANEDDGINFDHLSYSHTEEPETWHVDENVPPDKN